MTRTRPCLFVSRSLDAPSTLAPHAVVSGLGTRSLVAVGIAAMVAVGCSKKSDSSVEPAQASATPESAPEAPPPKPDPKTTFRGAYTSTPGRLYVPSGTDVPNAKEWDNVKWRGEESDAALGEGVLSLVVDAETGSVRGSVDGPLGPATVRGVLADDVVTGSIEPKDTTPPALYGTLRAARAGGALEGQMNLATSLGHVLRTATFRLEATTGAAPESEPRPEAAP